MIYKGQFVHKADSSKKVGRVIGIDGFGLVTVTTNVGTTEYWDIQTITLFLNEEIVKGSAVYDVRDENPFWVVAEHPIDPGIVQCENALGLIWVPKNVLRIKRDFDLCDDITLIDPNGNALGEGVIYERDVFTFRYTVYLTQSGKIVRNVRSTYLLPRGRMLVENLESPSPKEAPKHHVDEFYKLAMTWRDQENEESWQALVTYVFGDDER